MLHLRRWPLTYRFNAWALCCNKQETLPARGQNANRYSQMSLALCVSRVILQRGNGRKSIREKEGSWTKSRRSLQRRFRTLGFLWFMERHVLTNAYTRTQALSTINSRSTNTPIHARMQINVRINLYSSNYTSCTSSRIVCICVHNTLLYA